MAECRKGIPSKYSRVTRSLFLKAMSQLSSGGLASLIDTVLGQVL